MNPGRFNDFINGRNIGGTIDTFILTSGAWLSPLAGHDVGVFASHLSRARNQIRPWVGLPLFAATEEGAANTLSSYADSEMPEGTRIFGIWLEGVLVGAAFFTALTADAAGGGTAKIGCWLEPDAVGKGLATLSCEMLLSWAFDSFGMRRVEWVCRADSDGSVALAKRLGFRLETNCRRSWLFDGHYYDTQIWTTLVDEWGKNLHGTVRAEGVCRQDMQALILEHHDEMRTVAGAGGSNALGLQALSAPEITLYGLREQGRLLGCVAFKHLGAESGEVKTLRTTKSARGTGGGGKLLDHLIEVGRARGYRHIYLETHPEDHFQAARALYHGRGFRQCGPFADYSEGLRSYFMVLQL